MAPQLISFDSAARDIRGRLAITYDKSSDFFILGGCTEITFYSPTHEDPSSSFLISIDFEGDRFDIEIPQVVDKVEYSGMCLMDVSDICEQLVKGMRKITKKSKMGPKSVVE